MMPKIDISSIKIESSTGYPAPFRDAVAGRSRQRLGNVVGLDQFGVNLTRLKPGSQSSQRHWHETEDELIYVLEGELVLCEDDGETVLKPGDAAGWKAGVANGIASSIARIAMQSTSKSAPACRATAPNIPTST